MKLMGIRKNGNDFEARVKPLGKTKRNKHGELEGTFENVKTGSRYVVRGGRAYMSTCTTARYLCDPAYIEEN